MNISTYKISSCDEGGFIADIGDIRAREPWSESSQLARQVVLVQVGLQSTQMHLEDGRSTLKKCHCASRKVSFM